MVLKSVYQLSFDKTQDSRKTRLNVSIKLLAVSALVQNITLHDDKVLSTLE